MCMDISSHTQHPCVQLEITIHIMIVTTMGMVSIKVSSNFVNCEEVGHVVGPCVLCQDTFCNESKFSLRANWQVACLRPHI